MVSIASAKRVWCSYQWNYLCGFGNESVCQLFIEGDEMSNIYVAVVLLQKNVLADLISADLLAPTLATLQCAYVITNL